ncbi:MAG: arsinothricin resistance N-acetyltransferase ArsN1 family A [Trueperaceae bacterium]
MPGLAIEPATLADLPEVAAIYNEGIRDRIATFETRERAPEELTGWLDDPDHPLLVARDHDDQHVLGWIAATTYRSRPCYDGIAEFSVYVARDARGRKVGHALMEAFLPACERVGIWKILSRVFPENVGSRKLLARHGFREVGTYLRHARLDHAWKDVVIVERLLGEALRDLLEAEAAGEG